MELLAPLVHLEVLGLRPDDRMWMPLESQTISDVQRSFAARGRALLVVPCSPPPEDCGPGDENSATHLRNNINNPAF